MDLRGKTSLEEMAAVIAASDMYIGPISGPYHIAAAVGIPSIAVSGGFEHPENTRYPKSIIFSSDLSCAPCWLRTECPNSKECLTTILPIDVEKVVLTLMPN